MVGVTGGAGTQLSDYTTTIGGECASDGSVRLSGGDHKTCVVTSIAKSTQSACVTKCTIDRDMCLAEGILLSGECVQEFNQCKEGCAP